MGTNSRFGSKQSPGRDTANTPGVRLDNGAYIAIIKNNLDPTRSGRMQVFIPDLGGDENDRTGWVTIRYASPFIGSTNIPKEKREKKNDWSKNPHTYGMWFPPPDLEAQVLVVFASGNMSHGFYVGNIMPNLGNYMVPAIGGSDYLDKTYLDPELAANLPGARYPVTEFNEEIGYWDERTDFIKIKKPIHESLARVMLEQGLEDDLARGVIRSSSQRESPSSCFGVSTPGKAPTDPSLLDDKTFSPKFRLGGHSFLMDDGSAEGDDNMIRLRTSGGHQIMMNDTEGTMYIGNMVGTVWLEFTNEGKVHLFANDAINIRSKQSINMHSDKDINMYAANDINMYAVNNIREESKNIHVKATDFLEEFGGKVQVSSGTYMHLESVTEGTWNDKTRLAFSADTDLTLKSKGTFGSHSSGPMRIKSESPLVISSSIGSWNGGAKLQFSAGVILLNTGSAPIAATSPIAPSVPEIPPIPVLVHPETNKVGLKWLPRITVESTVEVVPTHEPWIKDINGVDVHNKRN